MDTKLKKSRYNTSFKAIAVILCMLSVCVIATVLPLVVTANVSGVLPNYEESNECNNYLTGTADLAKQAYVDTSGLDFQQRVDDKIDQLKLERDEELERILQIGTSGEMAEEAAAAEAGESYDVSEDTGVDAIEASLEVEAAPTTKDDTYTDTGDAIADYKANRINEVRERYNQQVRQAEDLVRQDIAQFQQIAKETLHEDENMLYAVFSINDLKAPVHTNIEEADPLHALSQLKATYGSIYSHGPYSSGDTSYGSISGGNYSGFLDFIESNKDRELLTDSSTEDIQVIAVGMSEEFFAANESAYRAEHSRFEYNMLFLFVSLAVFVLSLIWLMATAGKNPWDDTIKIGWMDTIYLDIGFVLMLIANILLFTIALWIAYMRMVLIDPLHTAGYYACIAAGVTLFLLWMTSLARRTKDGSAKEHTLMYKLFGGLGKAYRATSHGAQTVIGVLLSALIGFVIIVTCMYLYYQYGGVFVLICIIASIIYIFALLRMHLNRAAALTTLAGGVQRIKEGDTAHIIPATDNENVNQIAEDVNNIAEGFTNAVTREVQAERMKTELITNISHDIKTPLTSILSYVDLLKKENGLSDTAMDYVNVLDMKSHRLKVLTDDLFEAAKATSGDMAVDMTRIELIQLLEQTLAELSDQIDKSQLTFVSELPEGAQMHVEADGKLLFRVLWNIVDNAIRYSLPGSRIYLSVLQEDERVCVELKNISKEELNITEDELMERFVRGDSSRKTEGSGLGLSIARNYVEHMDGTFDITIDGDLFKVIVCLKNSES